MKRGPQPGFKRQPPCIKVKLETLNQFFKPEAEIPVSRDLAFLFGIEEKSTDESTEQIAQSTDETPTLEVKVTRFETNKKI